MGIFKKKIILKSYDKENKKPVIKASICNGEIEEIMLIKDPADLNIFKEMYGIKEEIMKEY